MDDWINEKIFKWTKNTWNNDTIREKGCVKTLLFDSVPIENYIFPLLHVEISISKKIVHSYLERINERIERISDEEVNMTSFLINGKIKPKNYQKQYGDWVNNKNSLSAELRLERQDIQSFLKRMR